MRGWINWFRNNGSRYLWCLCLLAAVVLGVFGPAPAQESFDQRLERAKDLFNNAKMDDACDAFQQLDKEKPGDKQTQPYLKMSCAQKEHLQKSEEDLFNQGVQFFNQGQLDDARQKFEQVGRFQGLKDPRYRNKALDYIKQIDTRQNEEHAFQEGVKLFNDGKYAEAQTRFNPLAQGGGPHAGEARSYLTKIGEALQKQRDAEQVRQTFDEGVRFYNAKDYANAYFAFAKVVKAGGPKAAEAQVYLGKIEQARKVEEAQAKVVAPTEPPKPPPSKPDERPPAVSDQSLRAGLKAYFAGDLDVAEQNLSNYINQNGPKQALAYFFRGATHGTRFYLSGEKDSHEKEVAVSDFQSAKTHDRAFQPPAQYVPRKIMALYSVAENPPSQ